MADIQDVGDRGIDISRGVRAGIDIVGGVERIKQGREQEARAEESFALDKKVTEQGLEIQKQQEVDRRKNKRIDTIERGIETAFKYKNFKATDELRQEWEIETGYHFGGDNEELATLLSDRRKAVNANDADEVAAIDSYLNDVRQVSPEEAAGTLGLTSEVEELGAERKFERGVKEEKQVFDIKTERKEKERVETTERVAKSLEGIEGLDETTKTLLPLISSGEVSAAVLNVLSSQSGVTFRENFLGTGTIAGKEGLKNKRVISVFNKEGDLVDEFEAAKPRRESRIVSTPGLLPGDQPTVQLYTATEDALGNPKLIVTDATTPESGALATPESKAVATEAAAPVQPEIIGIPSYLAGATQEEKDFFEDLVAIPENEGRIPTEKEFKDAFGGAKQQRVEENKEAAEAALPKVKLAEFTKDLSDIELSHYKAMVRGSGIIPTEKEFRKSFELRQRRFAPKIPISKKIRGILHRGKK